MTLTKDNYLPRLIDNEIQKMLRVSGAVAIDGPKWCGKTWTSLNHANSVVYLGSPENNFQYRTMAQIDPALVLEGSHPRLIDEWQEVPPIWDAVRFSVDQSTEKGRYLLTGSATPDFKGVLHSGAGRIIQMRMRTMSLFESGDSCGSVSLEGLFTSGLKSVNTGEVSLRNLIHLAVRGGWPGSVGLDPNLAAEPPKAYLEVVMKTDMTKVDGVKRDPRKVGLLLRSLARNESTVVSNNTLKKDMLEYDGEGIDVDTVSDYLSVLNKLFLIEDQPAFNPNMRSAVRVGKSAKRHYSDPSLAIAALGATPEMLLGDLNTFGFLFEALCERDLKIYAQTFGAKLFHYRDANGREIDAVVELADGSWGAFEIKLGTNQVDEAAKNLLRLKKDMEEDPKANPPKILCIICGMAAFAYVRNDGVMVMPITALKN